MTEREYTPRGQGNYNTVGASAGIASFLGLNAGNLLNNGGGNCSSNWNAGWCCSENTPVTRYELDMALNSAAKDSKIALLEANIFTDTKINDLGNRTLNTFNEIRGELREVAVYQGVNTASIACLKGQVSELMGLTKIVVPSSNVCTQNPQVIVANTPCDPVYTQVVPAATTTAG